jgi:hypothetical protein
MHLVHLLAETDEQLMQLESFTVHLLQIFRSKLYFK